MTLGVNGLHYPDEKILSVQDAGLKSKIPLLALSRTRGRAWQIMFLVNRIWKQTGVMSRKANFKPNNFAAIHLTENKYSENIKNSSSALLCECGEEPWSWRTGRMWNSKQELVNTHKSWCSWSNLQNNSIDITSKRWETKSWAWLKQSQVFENKKRNLRVGECLWTSVRTPSHPCRAWKNGFRL